MKTRWAVIYLSLVTIVVSGCARDASRIEQNKAGLRSLRVNDDTASLMICESFPDAKRYSIASPVACELRDILMRAEPFHDELLDGVIGTVSPPGNLSWIEFGDLRWYFLPPDDPHGFKLSSSDRSRFGELVYLVQHSK